jgi:hypothetical protein
MDLHMGKWTLITFNDDDDDDDDYDYDDDDDNNNNKPYGGTNKHKLIGPSPITSQTL